MRFFFQVIRLPSYLRASVMKLIIYVGRDVACDGTASPGVSLNTTALLVNFIHEFRRSLRIRSGH